jgi:lysozyme family protein
VEFEQVVTAIMKAEGGYVDDAKDPGGATKWGISKKSFPDINIKTLTEEQARSLYFTHYWVPGKCGLLSERIRLIYFDMCVHQGIASAVTTLQKALSSAGYAVEIDGIIGTETISASIHLEQDRLRSYRVLRLANIVTNNPAMEKYWYGWYKRALTM